MSKKAQEEKKGITVSLKAWAGKPCDKPSGRETSAVEAMFTRMLAELAKHGLEGGDYAIHLDSRSSIHQGPFQISKRSGTSTRPGVFFRVSLERGDPIAVRLMRSDGKHSHYAANFGNAWASWLGRQVNVVRFNKDCTTLFGEAKPQQVTQPQAESSEPVGTDAEQAEVPNEAEKAGAARTDSNDPANDAKKENKLEKLGKFLSDRVNQVLIVGQLVDHAVRMGRLTIGFDEWVDLASADLGTTHSTSKLAVTSAIITPARRLGLVARWVTPSGHTAYAPTKAGLELLESEPSYGHTLQGYIKLVKQCDYTTDEIDSIRSSPEMCETLVFVAASHNLATQLRTAIGNMAQEVADFQRTEAEFVERIESRKAEIAKLEEELETARAIVVQQHEIDAVSDALRDLAGIEAEFADLIRPADKK